MSMIAAPLTGDNGAVPPQHIAIIMDGNNRWARREGYPGVAGHRAGAEVVRAKYAGAL